MTMTRRNRTSNRLARLLPSPARFAAAAAVHDPRLLLALQATAATTRRAGAAPTSPYAGR